MEPRASARVRSVRIPSQPGDSKISERWNERDFFGPERTETSTEAQKKNSRALLFLFAGFAVSFFFHRTRTKSGGDHNNDDCDDDNDDDDDDGR